MSRPSAFAIAVAGLAWILLFTSTALAQKPPAEKIEPTYNDHSYGPAAGDVLDFYLADSEHPAPLLIHWEASHAARFAR